MLELRNLSFGVDAGPGKKEILKNISLTVGENKFVVITGPNGGGKSTLAKMIMGIEKPTSGQILLDGEDMHLLLVRITGQTNHFHTVQQGSGDRIGGIGSGDKHDAAQVHRDLQEVIPEGAVLLAVQHLQQSGRRIAAVVAAQLVDLIQQQQRIHGPAAADGLNDTAGHRADVRFAVAADVRLVTDAAQRQAGQLAVQRGGNRDSNGGLTNARRVSGYSMLVHPDSFQI